jgi:hypothetical protein
LDAIFPPHPVLPGTQAGEFAFGDADQLGVPGLVGVDRLVAARGQRSDHRRLAGA